MNHKMLLLEAANVYSIRTGRALSGVAKEILRDSKFFDRIAAGSGCTMDTYEKVMAWFATNTPKKEIRKR